MYKTLDLIWKLQKLTSIESDIYWTINPDGRLESTVRSWTMGICHYFGGCLRPEYSHFFQYIGELGERGGSKEFMIRYGAFVPTGLMHSRVARLPNLRPC